MFEEAFLQLTRADKEAFAKAINEVIVNKRPESKDYNFEVRSVIEPVYHNVISLRGED